MTLNQANFNTDTAAGTLTGFTLPVATVIRQLGGVATTTSATGTVLALTAKVPSGLNQFSQIKLVNNVGTSVSVVTRASFVGTGTETGYILRHTGSDLAIIKFLNGANSTLVNIAHTRVAGQTLKLTAVTTDTATGATTLVGYVNDVEVLRIIDTTNPLAAKGSTGFRIATSNGVQVDDYAGGDVADMSSVVAGADNMVSFVEIIPTPNADGIPKWRGLRYNLAGERILFGEKLHEQKLDMWGASGAYTPPTGWAVGAGTAALSSPNAGIGFLELTTDGTLGGKASLTCSVPIASAQHGAIMITVEGLHFAVANTSADLRIMATDGANVGGGLAQNNGAEHAFLFSNGENYRTIVEPSYLGENAARRRPVSILISPGTKEIWLLERDRVVAYHDALPAWTDGSMTVSVEITARTAAATRLRMTSLTLATFA